MANDTKRVQVYDENDELIDAYLKAKAKAAKATSELDAFKAQINKLPKGIHNGTAKAVERSVRLDVGIDVAKAINIVGVKKLTPHFSLSKKAAGEVMTAEQVKDAASDEIRKVQTIRECARVEERRSIKRKVA